MENFYNKLNIKLSEQYKLTVRNDIFLNPNSN